MSSTMTDTDQYIHINLPNQSRKCLHDRYDVIVTIGVVTVVVVEDIQPVLAQPLFSPYLW